MIANEHTELNDHQRVSANISDYQRSAYTAQHSEYKGERADQLADRSGQNVEYSCASIHDRVSNRPKSSQRVAIEAAKEHAEQQSEHSDLCSVRTYPVIRKLQQPATAKRTHEIANEDTEKRNLNEWHNQPADEPKKRTCTNHLKNGLGSSSSLVSLRWSSTRLASKTNGALNQTTSANRLATVCASQARFFMSAF